ncbi:MAG TPA: hypothetical protein VF475_09020 [Sphingobium sp.]
MQIDNPKLCATYRKVQLVREHMGQVCLGKHEPALRIMNLHHVIQDMYGLQIEMREVDFPAVHLKGKIERYSDKRARILVRASLSDAEKRSTAVKELCHLMLDQEEDWSPRGTDTIDELMLDASLLASNGVGNANPSAPLMSEALAILAGTELMYPGEYHDGDLARLKENLTTISAIALQHDVPPYIIQHAYTNKEVRDRVCAQIAAEMPAAANDDAKRSSM